MHQGNQKTDTHRDENDNTHQAINTPKFFEYDLVWQLIDKMPDRDHTTFCVMCKRYASAHLVQEAINQYI